MTARGPTHVWRIAMIYALIDRSRIIRRPHLDAALAVWEYAERSTRYIFGDALGYPVADHILQKLRSVSPDGVTRTEIVDLFARHAKAPIIADALGMLQERGLAHSRRVAAPDGSKGDPTRILVRHSRNTRWPFTRTYRVCDRARCERSEKNSRP